MARARRQDRIPAPPAWVAGIAAVVLGIGLGELAAAIVAPPSSPVAAVGSALIDVAPPWAKDTAIALFGTGDKIALLTGIAILLLVLAALAGWLQVRFPPWGVVLVAAFGAGGAIVAATRPGAGALAWLPAVVAGAAGALTLHLLARLLRRTAPAHLGAPAPVAAESDPRERTDDATRRPVASEPGVSPDVSADADPREGMDADPRERMDAPSRRTFFAWAGAATAVGVIAVAVGTLRTTASTGVAAARRALRLPPPATTASPVPAGAELDLPGLADVVTPNDGFYRIDTALIVPEIDPAVWRLRIHGMVAHEVELTWDELTALPLQESWTTLACVSNEVGGSLIGNALWLGYPVRELLARAQPSADADMVLSRSIDGFTASTPLEALTDGRDAILAVGMNGQPLPLEHGFPVRMVVPGLYGYVSATKWVTDLEVTRFDRARAYWTDRGWSERGPIKLESRIDVPRRAQGLKAGEVMIAGVAWQQHVGIRSVQVRIDEGEWQDATLATAISDDTWVQWSLPWQAEKGDHVIQCRATSKTGETQTEVTAPPAPDGATGWHWRTVSVF
ncbi:molybdopterin-dependent oxidoreductase [Microbacterium kyungheense]|uniref:DMSO/TMAO reductase YedYZ molybdopterin-dependent catalytic subunit n=1 Tax=Microbacterium kyungheense TaxID=1263636 RepID=A0A543EPX7_9MICO|nr:molybdopterin-dependent oxidoreductase [Microbacterium kyungheense]TQM23651.1 DMSO/TMAO reductase YedYZ molybdopterin-dependent catalytic subunit [Microbacterium kyungheense]